MVVDKVSLGYLHLESIFQEEAIIDVGSFVGSSVGECPGKWEGSTLGYSIGV